MAGENDNKNAITAEQLSEMETRINAAAANMVTARLGALEKKIIEKVTGSFGEQLTKTLDEKLQALKPNDDGSNSSGNKGKKDVEIETLRRELAQVKESQAQADAAARAATEKMRRQELHAATLNQLREVLKIEGMAAQLAASHLIATGRIGYDEDGDNPDRRIFRDENGAVDLPMGLKAWGKTDEGKFYIPAVNARGSGSRPGGFSPGAGPNGELTNDQKLARLSQLLEDNLT